MAALRRACALAGLSVAKIGGFSIVFVAMGTSPGHTGPSALGLTTLAGLVTITLSTWKMLYRYPL